MRGHPDTPEGPGSVCPVCPMSPVFPVCPVYSVCPVCWRQCQGRAPRPDTAPGAQTRTKLTQGQTRREKSDQGFVTAAARASTPGTAPGPQRSGPRCSPTGARCWPRRDLKALPGASGLLPTAPRLRRTEGAAARRARGPAPTAGRAPRAGASPVPAGHTPRLPPRVPQLHRLHGALSAGRVRPSLTAPWHGSSAASARCRMPAGAPPALPPGARLPGRGGGAMAACPDALRRAGNEEFRRGQYGPAAQLYSRALAQLEATGRARPGAGGRAGAPLWIRADPRLSRVCPAQGMPAPRSAACCWPTAPPATSRTAPAACAWPTAPGEHGGAGGALSAGPSSPGALLTALCALPQRPGAGPVRHQAPPAAGSGVRGSGAVLAGLCGLQDGAAGGLLRAGGARWGQQVRSGARGSGMRRWCCCSSRAHRCSTELGPWHTSKAKPGPAPCACWCLSLVSRCWFQVWQ